jgi:hypothetical protein
MKYIKSNKEYAETYLAIEHHVKNIGNVVPIEYMYEGVATTWVTIKAWVILDSGVVELKQAQGVEHKDGSEGYYDSVPPIKDQLKELNGIKGLIIKFDRVDDWSDWKPIHEVLVVDWPLQAVEEVKESVGKMRVEKIEDSRDIRYLPEEDV